MAHAILSVYIYLQMCTLEIAFQMNCHKRLRLDNFETFLLRNSISPDNASLTLWRTMLQDPWLWFLQWARSSSLNPNPFPWNGLLRFPTNRSWVLWPDRANTLHELVVRTSIHHQSYHCSCNVQIDSLDFIATCFALLWLSW